MSRIDDMRGCLWHSLGLLYPVSSGGVQEGLVTASTPESASINVAFLVPASLVQYNRKPCKALKPKTVNSTGFKVLECRTRSLRKAQSTPGRSVHVFRARLGPGSWKGFRSAFLVLGV